MDTPEEGFSHLIAWSLRWHQWEGGRVEGKIWSEEWLTKFQGPIMENGSVMIVGTAAAAGRRRGATQVILIGVDQ